MYKKSFISVILLAGGKGMRMKTAVPKQFSLLAGKMLALYSYDFFDQLPWIDEIIVVCPKQYQHHFTGTTPTIFALPGKERQDSLASGMAKIASNSHLVCIHDSARPFLEKKKVENVILAAQEHGAAALGTLEKNTIKITDNDAMVLHTIERKNLWSIQTPQVIHTALLQKSLQRHKDIPVTDDVSLIEHEQQPVKIVTGSEKNIKITTPFDLQIAKEILKNEI